MIYPHRWAATLCLEVDSLEAWGGPDFGAWGEGVYSMEALGSTSKRKEKEM